MSKGFSKPIVGVILLAAIFGGYILVNAGGFLFSTGQTFFNGCTWQPDYWFVTCQPVEHQTVRLYSLEAPGFLRGDRIYTCPVGADIHECEIVTTSDPRLVEAASCGAFDCADKHSISTGSKVKPGRVIRGLTPDTTIRVLKKELRSCGTSACSAGSGIPIPGVQGCSFTSSSDTQSLANLIGGGVTASDIDPIDTVAVGQSYQFVYSQHLVSCPQNCAPGVDDLSCSTPSSVRSGTTTYQGKQVKWYGSTAGINILGCKGDQQCVKYNDDFSKCIEYSNDGYGQCGTLAQLDAGQCVQNSDCGDTSRYACDFDNGALKGTCVPIEQAPTQECSTDFDCSQTGATCNAKQLGGSVCRSGQCVIESTPVQCCTSSDCSAGFFCNADYVCQNSEDQKPDPPAGQCSEGNPSYRDRTCSDMTGGELTVCCSDGSCAETEDECGQGNQPSPFTCVGENQRLTLSNDQCCEGLAPIQDNFAGPTICKHEELNIPLTAIVAGLFGLVAAILIGSTGKKRWGLGIAAGALIGVVVYALLGFLMQTWWIGLIAGLAGLWLLAPAIPGVLLLIAIVMSRR